MDDLWEQQAHLMYLQYLKGLENKITKRRHEILFQKELSSTTDWYKHHEKSICVCVCIESLKHSKWMENQLISKIKHIYGNFPLIELVHNNDTDKV